MSKKFWIVVGIAVIALVGLFIATNEPSEQTSIEEPLEITDEDHTIGESDAPIELVKYSDFQCPSCAQADPIVKDILDEYGDDIHFVYRHFHVVQPQSTSHLASRATVAAERQDAFWEMHDLLFERQDDWAQNAEAPSLINGYAEELGLDMEQFETDLDDADNRVDRDLDIAQQLGLFSTPTFFINGEQVQQQYVELPRLIEEELAQADDQDEDSQE